MLISGRTIHLVAILPNGDAYRWNTNDAERAAPMMESPPAFTFIITNNLDISELRTVILWTTSRVGSWLIVLWRGEQLDLMTTLLPTRASPRPAVIILGAFIFMSRRSAAPRATAIAA